MRRLAAAILALALLAAPAAANSLASIVVEKNGDVYFSDYVRDKIWKVSAGGELSVALANRHSYHLVQDPEGSIYGEHRSGRGGDVVIWRLDAEGRSQDVFRTARFGQAASYRGTVFTIDPRGNLLYVRDCQIVRLGKDGGLVPITPNPCHETAWTDPRVVYGHLHGSLAWGPDETLYFSDGLTIRRVLRDGTVTTLAGRPAVLFAEPGPGETVFDSLTGLAVNAGGEVFAADRSSRTILKFGRDGRRVVVARLGMLSSPIGLAVSGDAVYVLLNLRFATPGFLSGVVGNPTLKKLSASGRLTTVSTVRVRTR